MNELEVWPGHAYPLGANFDGTGTTSALFSEVAEAVDLCLFNDGDRNSECPSRRSMLSPGTRTCPM
jgi:glycogen operon protein